MRIGILGGTFDPIHIAHLHAAECALTQFDLDTVLLIPVGDPWQKHDREVTAGEHRLEMCRIAVGGVADLQVDDREVLREGPTYTLDTLDEFEDSDELFLILGDDAVANIHTWHRSSEVLERTELLIAPRSGNHSYDQVHGRRIDMGLLEVSATDIRSRAAAGRPFRYLVTEAVHEYINAHGLYTQGA